MRWYLTGTLALHCSDMMIMAREGTTAGIFQKPNYTPTYTMEVSKEFQQFENLEKEQLPVAKHRLHDWTHFAGLYAAEHVAATEFVIGATFVALGAKTMDILLGLLIGNV